MVDWWTNIWGFDLDFPGLTIVVTRSSGFSVGSMLMITSTVG